MTSQEVSVKFPDIQLLVNGKVVRQLATYKTYAHTVKMLRGDVEKYLENFIEEIGYHAGGGYRKNYGSATKVTVPAVEIWVEGKREFYVGKVEMEAVRLSRWHLHKTLGKNVSTAVAHICVEAIEHHGASVTFQEDGITIDCPLRTNTGNWAWNLVLSEVMITYERGSRVNVKYGSFIHNALWRLDRALDSFHAQVKDLQTFTTLQRLGLVEPENQRLSLRGKQVLAELDEIDPSDVPSLVILFAGTILGTQHEQVPIAQFVKEHEFAKHVGDRIPEILPKGKEWLIDNCLAVVSSSNCSNERKLRLVEFMPLAYLPPFLTHENEKIRDAARRRANMLEEV